MNDSLSIINKFIISKTAARSPNGTTYIYRNLNGELWQLIQKPPAGCFRVRHTSSLSAEQKISEISVEEFLARNVSGPERTAFFSLLERC